MFCSPSNVYVMCLFGKSYIRDVWTDADYLFRYVCLDAAFHTSRQKLQGERKYIYHSNTLVKK
jgi:hypothetical protein